MGGAGRRDGDALRELRTTDVLVVLGGDGTFLRAVRAVAEVDVPILGINLGKVGFLSKAEADELEPVLGQLVEGRTSRGADGARGPDPAAAAAPTSGEPFTALNDIVDRPRLARPRRAGSTSPSTSRHLATFIADGLVVSSPTGSTGYSFSAGGPILDPHSRNLVVTPIAGYLSAIRSVVVAPAQVVRCRVVDAHEALVSIDGREDHRSRSATSSRSGRWNGRSGSSSREGASRSGTCCGRRSSCCRRERSRRDRLDAGRTPAASSSWRSRTSR